MRARTRTLTLAACALAVAFAAGPGRAKTAQEEAREAAMAWLALVDSGRYGESWDDAAPYFQKAVSRESWEKQVAAVRKPLGAVGSRSFLGAQATKELPGAPDGDYVVIQFRTSFDNKASSIETITPMKTDSGWRVSGYFIR